MTRHQPPPAPNLGALTEMLQASGEWDDVIAAGPSYEPAPTVTASPPGDAGLVIEPPEWDDQPDSFFAPAEETRPLVDGAALAEMKTGDPDEEEPGPPRIFAGVDWTPLRPVVLPEPDWRQEEADRAQEREP